MNFRKLLCTMTALSTLSLVALTGCGDKESSSNDIVKQEDLPYGATIRSDKSTNVNIEYDHRFVTDAEAIAIANYFDSIQTQNMDLLLECVYPEYVDAVATYAELGDRNGYLEYTHNVIKSVLEADTYEFTSVSVVSAMDQSVLNPVIIDEGKTMTDEMLATVGADPISSKVTYIKYVEVDINCNVNDTPVMLSSKAGNYQELLIYYIDDKIYIF